MIAKARFFCGACPVRPLLEAGVKARRTQETHPRHTRGQRRASRRIVTAANAAAPVLETATAVCRPVVSAVRSWRALTALNRQLHRLAFR